MKHYYYLHTNGNLIHKSINIGNPYDYFDSDFVHSWWEVDDTKREDAWIVILESLTYEKVNIKEIGELIKKWNLTYEDSKEMLVFFSENKMINSKRKLGLSIYVKTFLNMTLEEYFNKIEDEK